MIEHPNTPAAPDVDVVLTQAEAAQLMRLSERTLQRLDEVGEAPPRIALTGRRVGYWRSHVLAWLYARTAPAKRVA